MNGSHKKVGIDCHFKSLGLVQCCNLAQEVVRVSDGLRPGLYLYSFLTINALKVVLVVLGCRWQG